MRCIVENPHDRNEPGQGRSGRSGSECRGCCPVRKCLAEGSMDDLAGLLNVEETVNSRKRPTANRWRKQARLVCLSTLVVLIMGLGSVLTFVPHATAKQQDCPFGKVWSDEQGKCITFVLTERDEG